MQTGGAFLALRRLSNQLHVDFASDVHSAEGKRKREPTRSIYEEAEHNMKMGAKQRALKRLMKKAGACRIDNTKENKHVEKDATAKPASAEISEVEEDENTDSRDQTFISMMHAAASLAELRVRSEQSRSGALDQNAVLAIEAISKAHAETIAAKDEVIQTVNAVLAVKEELIQTQAALIEAMKQKCAALD